MRFLHVSDTHVGFSQYHRVTAEGLNQREQDFFDAFRRAIDLAIAERVECVLHSGDVFDSVRPTNRAVSFAMEEVRRLGEAGIPFVAIAGNHEAPKLRETGSVLRFFDFLPNARAVYRGRYEAVRIGETAFHCVPHAASQDALLEELARAKPDPSARWNVLALHVGVVGVAEFRSGEFNEQSVNLADLPRDFDYIALGHYHRATKVTENAWYAGSTERSSFKEAGEAKGANLVDLARGDVAFRPLPAREMITLPAVECASLDPRLVVPAIFERLEGADLAGKIVRLAVRGIPAHVLATLDHARLARLAEGALHFQSEFEVARADGAARGSATMGALTDELGAFLAATPVAGLDRERLAREATALLAEAQAARVAEAGE